MRATTFLRFPFCLLFAVALLPLGCARQEEADAEADAAAASELLQRYSSSLNSGDVDAWIALWTDDGIQMPPNSPPNVGKDRIRESIETALDRFSFDMSIRNAEVRATGDWAYIRGTYTATLKPKQGSEPILIDGKYMSILQRQPDGSWKLHRDIFNSNVPPAEN